MPNKKKWTQMTLNPLFYLAAGKCRERDSNPHNHFWSRDFKSLVSTIPPSRQLFAGAKVRLFIGITKFFRIFSRILYR